MNYAAFNLVIIIFIVVIFLLLIIPTWKATSVHPPATTHRHKQQAKDLNQDGEPPGHLGPSLLVTNPSPS